MTAFYIFPWYTIVEFILLGGGDRGGGPVLVPRPARNKVRLPVIIYVPTRRRQQHLYLLCRQQHLYPLCRQQHPSFSSLCPERSGSNQCLFTLCFAKTILHIKDTVCKNGSKLPIPALIKGNLQPPIYIYIFFNLLSMLCPLWTETWTFMQHCKSLDFVHTLRRLPNIDGQPPSQFNGVTR